MTTETLALTVKEDKADYIKECYPCFGWTLTEENADGNFFDLRHLSFQRPFLIENKDELQYLQVRMEMRFNRIETCQRKRFALSTAFFVLCALVGVGLLLFGLYFLIPNTHPYIGTMLCVISAVLFIAMVVVGKNLIARENARYLRLVSEMEKEIIDFCEEAEALTGGKHGTL